MPCPNVGNGSNQFVFFFIKFSVLRCNYESCFVWKEGTIFNEKVILKVIFNQKNNVLTIVRNWSGKSFQNVEYIYILAARLPNVLIFLKQRRRVSFP